MQNTPTEGKQVYRVAASCDVLQWYSFQRTEAITKFTVTELSKQASQLDCHHCICRSLGTCAQEDRDRTHWSGICSGPFGYRSLIIKFDPSSQRDTFDDVVHVDPGAEVCEDTLTCRLAHAHTLCICHCGCMLDVINQLGDRLATGHLLEQARPIGLIRVVRQ
mmetsp:Transcript_105393/g.209449  ORF Transcript_105393/g.209449 Transcript_105393/m.209449 type:complete len:163 (+) Transcript_105393:146-634(+)